MSTQSSRHSRKHLFLIRPGNITGSYQKTILSPKNSKMQLKNKASFLKIREGMNRDAYKDRTLHETLALHKKYTGVKRCCSYPQEIFKN